MASERSCCLLLAGTTRAGRLAAAYATHLLGPHGDGPFIGVACSSLVAVSAAAMLDEFFTREAGVNAAVISGVSVSALIEEYLWEEPGATLYLHEIEALTLEDQTFVLRLAERLGSQTGPITRLLLSTATDAAKLVQDGRLSAELYARLASHASHLVVPPALLSEPPRVWIVRRRADFSPTEIPGSSPELPPSAAGRDDDGSGDPPTF